MCRRMLRRAKAIKAAIERLWKGAVKVLDPILLQTRGPQLVLHQVLWCRFEGTVLPKAGYIQIMQVPLDRERHGRRSRT